MIHDSAGVDWSKLKQGSPLLGVDAHAPVEVIASSPVSATNSYNVVYRRIDGTTAIFVADDKTKEIAARRDAVGNDIVARLASMGGANVEVTSRLRRIYRLRSMPSLKSACVRRPLPTSSTTRNSIRKY